MGRGTKPYLAMIFFPCFFLYWGFCAAELASLPPRGWNSYDSFSWVVNESAFLDNAGILSNRLKPFGYEYAVVDYLWYRKNVPAAGGDMYGYDKIDQWGRLVPDPDRWPSSTCGNGFKEVAKKVHDMGLKFGIHVMRGISTAAYNANTPIYDVFKRDKYTKGGRVWRAKDIGMEKMRCKWMMNGFMSVNTDLEAGRAFLRSLYQQYAEWGVDFVKLDCVFGEDLDMKEILTVSELLKGLDPPVLLSISPGTGVTPSLAEGVSDYVNMYRITGDDWDTWGDVAAHFDIARDLAAANKIGAHGKRGRSWPDLDMLPLGWLTDPGVQQGPHRNCRLTLDEQRTQMTLWSMARSPLMFGGDLRHIDDVTFGLITNPTLMEINCFSTKNQEFPYISATEDLRNRHAVIKGIVSRESVNAPGKLLQLVSCSDSKAQGWVISSSHEKLNQTCWNFDIKGTENSPYCLYKRGPLLPWERSGTFNFKHTETFQLFSAETTSACLDASVKKKRTASEIASISFSSCRYIVDQMWRFNDNRTLESSSSSMCATVVSKKGLPNTTGARSWIATGRKGEIFVSFFNLNSRKTVILATIKDIAKDLGHNFSEKTSCDCNEVWTGQHYGRVTDTLTATVSKHGCMLFILICNKNIM